MCDIDVMTVKEVSQLLKCGLSTVYEMCENGTLKTFKLKPGSRKGIRVLGKSVADLMTGPEPAAKSEDPLPARESFKPAPSRLQATSILRFRD